MTAKKNAAKAGEDLSGAKVAEASGAIIEPEIAKVPDHPSVDNNPREHSTPEMNQIDFNTPSALQSQEEQVADELDGGNA